MEANPINNENVFLCRKANVWFTMQDGNWNDPNVWMGNGYDRAKVTIPVAGDTVYINHNITYNQASATLKDVFIAGKLTFATGAPQLTILGNLQCTGTLDMSAGAGTVILKGNNNFINSFICGTASTIAYNSSFDQPILPLTYANLTVTYATKYFTGNTTVNNSLNASLVVLEMGMYNGTFLGAVHLTNFAVLSKSGAGIVNLTSIDNTGGNSNEAINFSGNPIVNFSAGSIVGYWGYINFGNNTLNILGNQNWQITGPGYSPISTGTNSVVIANGVTLTIDKYNGQNTNGWINNGSVTGATATATLNIITVYSYGNSNIPMPTGIFNYNSSSTIQVEYGVTLTLPAASYPNLTINGTVTLGGNTTISGVLNVSGSLQLAAYNLSVTGASNIVGVLQKSGTGTVNFGNINMGIGSINFSGNPTVNLSGNIDGFCNNDLGNLAINLGQGIITAIANLTISLFGGGVTPAVIVIPWNLIIAAGVTVTNAMSAQIASGGGIVTTGTINGAAATSIFINNTYFEYDNATAPMVTGKLYCNQAVNTFIYGLAGNQDITVPTDTVSPGYKNLTLKGSGAKRLLGNVSVKGTYTLTAPATLNTNGFALTNP